MPAIESGPIRTRRRRSTGIPTVSINRRTTRLIPSAKVIVNIKPSRLSRSSRNSSGTTRLPSTTTPSRIRCKVAAVGRLSVRTWYSLVIP